MKLINATIPMICITQIDNGTGVINLVPVKILPQTLEDQSGYIKAKIMLENAIKKEEGFLPMEKRRKTSN